MVGLIDSPLFDGHIGCDDTAAAVRAAVIESEPGIESFLCQIGDLDLGVEHVSQSSGDIVAQRFGIWVGGNDESLHLFYPPS